MVLLMNRERDDSLYRIARVTQLLSAYRLNEDNYYSIAKLSKCLNVNDETIRDDIKQIINFGEKSSKVSIHKTVDDEEVTASELKQLSNDEKIYLFDELGSSINLVLDLEEYAVFNDLMNDKLKLSIEKDRFCWIKNSNVFDSKEYADCIYDINETIANGRSISFKYKKRNGGYDTIKIRPIKLLHAVDDSFFYIISHEMKFYRLDRILFDEIKPCKDLFELSDNVDLKKLDMMWGAEYSDTPTHVKIKIYREVGVPDRVLSDLGKRSDGHIQEYDDHIIYEDDIIGVNKFKSWVYGYGSSIVVLEPQSLRDEIIDSINERWKYYTETE